MDNIIREEIKRSVDPENLTETERTHIPLIEAPDVVTAGVPFDVTITVGSTPHIINNKHTIEWIELYLHNKLVGRKEFSLEENAKVTFRIEAEEELIAIKEIENCRVRGVNICGACGEKSIITNLRALESCNMHGIWEANKKIEIASEEEEEGKNVRGKPE